VESVFGVNMLANGETTKEMDRAHCRGTMDRSTSVNSRTTYKAGKVTLTWPNGQKFVGEFENDKPNGQGTYSFPGGAMYVGEIKDGLHSGQGTYTSAEGWTQSGVWKSGKFAKASPSGDRH
jgi:hypothetical protein